MNIDDYSSFIKDTGIRLDLIDSKIRRELAKHHPSHSPRIFLAILSTVVVVLREQLSDLWEKRLSEENRNDSKSLLRFLADYVPKLYSHFSIIDKTSSDQVPWSLIRPIERIFANIDTHHAVVVGGQLRMNYSYIEILRLYYFDSLASIGYEKDDLKRRMSQCVLDLFGASEYERLLPKKSGEVEPGATNQPSGEFYDRFSVIFFPEIERNFVFQHVLLGHEIGHNFFSAKNYRRLQPLFESETLRSSFQDNERSFSLALQFLIKGYVELACDVFAIKLFGVSVLFAAYGLFKDNQFFDIVGEISPFQTTYYPPGRYRLRLMCKALRADGWFDELVKAKSAATDATIKDVLAEVESHFLSIESVTTDKKDRASIDSSPISRAAYDIVDRNIDNGALLRAVDNVFPAGFSKGSQLDPSIVVSLTLRLDRGVLPAEIHPIVDESYLENAEVNYVHILNAAWYYWSYKLKRLDDLSEYSRLISQTNRLVLKAIELNEVSRRWNQNKGQTATVTQAS